MGWLIGERRGISWRDQTLESISAPPMHLLALLAVVVLLMCMSCYSEYKSQIEREKLGLKLVLFLLPVVLILMADLTAKYRWWTVVRVTQPAYERLSEEGSSPWGVALVVVLLLVLVKFQSSVQSMWF